MPMMLQGGPFAAPVAGLYRFTVKKYHKVIADGVMTEDDRVELLEGFLVDKMAHDPVHDGRSKDQSTASESASRSSVPFVGMFH